MTTERILPIFFNVLSHVSIAFFCKRPDTNFVQHSQISANLPKFPVGCCYSTKTALIPQTSHFTATKPSNSSCQQQNKLVDKENHLPEDWFIITSYYKHNMGGRLTFNVSTSSSCCEWTGMCCSRLFSSQYSSFSGRCASWENRAQIM